MYNLDMVWSIAVIFNRGSASERLPRVPQLASKNNPAYEITLDNVVEILSIDFFVLNFVFTCRFA